MNAVIDGVAQGEDTFSLSLYLFLWFFCELPSRPLRRPSRRLRRPSRPLRGHQQRFHISLPSGTGLMSHDSGAISATRQASISGGVAPTTSARCTVWGCVLYAGCPSRAYACALVTTSSHNTDAPRVYWVSLRPQTLLERDYLPFTLSPHILFWDADALKKMERPPALPYEPRIIPHLPSPY